MNTVLELADSGVVPYSIYRSIKMNTVLDLADSGVVHI